MARGALAAQARDRKFFEQPRLTASYEPAAGFKPVVRRRKVVYLGDIANVVYGTRWRTNIVHVNGRRAVYMLLLRQSGACVVSVADRVKKYLPKLHQRRTRKN